MGSDECSRCRDAQGWVPPLDSCERSLLWQKLLIECAAQQSLLYMAMQVECKGQSSTRNMMASYSITET